MNSSKGSVHFTLRSNYTRQDGTSAVNMRVTIARNTAYLPMGIHVKSTDWNQAKGNVRSTHSNSDDLNLVLDQARSRATEIFVYYRLSNRKLTMDQFREDYFHPETREDFLKFYEREMNRRWSKNIIDDATYISDKSILKKLHLFRRTWLSNRNLSADRPLRFADLTHRLLEDLDAWHLLYLRSKKGKGLVDQGRGTRHNLMKKVKCYLKIAMDVKGIPMENPFQSYRFQRGRETKLALKINQVRTLTVMFEDSSTPDHLRHVLRYFLFACHTGLRISDVRRLTTDNVQDGVLVFVPHKTRRRKPAPIRVPLSQKAMALIPEDLDEGDLLFACFADPVTNRHLKKIARMARLGVPLSFRYSRDTFATLFLELGGDVEVLQQLLGHSKIQDTMKYVKVTEERKKVQIVVMDRL